MTDYEMLSILIEFASTIWTVFATYVSIVFAFLVVSYLVSSKLKPELISIVVALYTLVALWASWVLNRGSASLVALVAEMKRSIQDGTSSLGWHPAAATPDFLLAVIPVLVTLVALLAYIGSLVFFYYQRKNPAD